MQLLVHRNFNCNCPSIAKLPEENFLKPRQATNASHNWHHIPGNAFHFQALICSKSYHFQQASSLQYTMDQLQNVLTHGRSRKSGIFGSMLADNQSNLGRRLPPFPWERIYSFQVEQNPGWLCIENYGSEILHKCQFLPGGCVYMHLSSHHSFCNSM